MNTAATRPDSRWDPTGPGTVAVLGAAALALLLALPLAAAHRLPAKLATHWSLSSPVPDDSMPLWAATALPAALWTAAVAVVLLAGRRARPWSPALLLPLGVSLCGAQAAIVRANLDHADWRDARSTTPWLIGVVVAALAAAAVGARLGRRAAPGAAQAPTDLPRLPIVPGERYVWLSRTANPWLQALAALAATATAAALVATTAGLVDPLWPLIAPLALVALAGAVSASVQATVTDRGLEVAFGPLGWPVRRWPLAAIESAHAEHRTPAQVGGWGYRLNGLGTTVMLRAGDCLVIRSKGRAFAVSVDDAERGAALLNTLRD
ncbi:DUF1648 domain-containing protein [Streptomyces sp. G45]|uniref:DUF1648 domain-containing protein n=1 Tax=Streptomyces sp. G45 TaxID=3406627 RepID=UPI003C161EC3